MPNDMQPNVGRAWTVPELAAVAGVSSRTIQRQFLAFLRKTPGAMLRDISFERARRELLQGSRRAKVMDISLRSGFPHSGRFSVEYRRRYGETPVPDAEASDRVRRGARGDAFLFCAVSRWADEDCLERVEGSTVQARVMYEAFKEWCYANSKAVIFETKFGRDMKRHFERDDGKRLRYYLNVKLWEDRPRADKSRSEISDPLDDVVPV
jgi:AraC-like DNA-binding protein